MKPLGDKRITDINSRVKFSGVKKPLADPILEQTDVVELKKEIKKEGMDDIERGLQLKKEASKQMGEGGGKIADGEKILKLGEDYLASYEIFKIAEEELQDKGLKDLDGGMSLESKGESLQEKGITGFEDLKEEEKISEGVKTLGDFLLKEGFLEEKTVESKQDKTAEKIQNELGKEKIQEDKKASGLKKAGLGFDIEKVGEALQDGATHYLAHSISLEKEGEDLKTSGRSLYVEGQKTGLAGEGKLVESFSSHMEANLLRHEASNIKEDALMHGARGKEELAEARHKGHKSAHLKEKQSELITLSHQKLLESIRKRKQAEKLYHQAGSCYQGGAWGVCSHPMFAVIPPSFFTPPFAMPIPFQFVHPVPLGCHMSNMGHGMHLLKMAECYKKQSLSAQFQAWGNITMATETGHEATHLAMEARIHRASARTQLALAHMLTLKSEEKEKKADEKEEKAKDLEQEGLGLKGKGRSLKEEALKKIKEGRDIEKDAHNLETLGLSLFDAGTEKEQAGRELEMQGLSDIGSAREKEVALKDRRAKLFKKFSHLLEMEGKARDKQEDGISLIKVGLGEEKDIKAEEEKKLKLIEIGVKLEALGKDMEERGMKLLREAKEFKKDADNAFDKGNYNLDKGSDIIEEGLALIKEGVQKQTAARLIIEKGIEYIELAGEIPAGLLD